MGSQRAHRLVGKSGCAWRTSTRFRAIWTQPRTCLQSRIYGSTRAWASIWWRFQGVKECAVRSEEHTSELQSLSLNGALPIYSVPSGRSRGHASNLESMEVHGHGLRSGGVFRG